ncbi:DUF4440 domain-containing protein [Puniceicoccales bacterium CK1056]|uniref:DUF4440 domain-containing protein n=1 Tax=Oceanipulchritudo coccoides TaxID=2706888 RepID=A0A6B2LY17_9BACT|nr:DUF4440 domain-containing protein [Oceanipulchritudo coccoides]NDV61501.1 DUF4440 domain-containing protein [Oceanipulchritudo coccoides]
MFDTSETLLHAWLDLVNAGDAEGVLALYNREAILQPTFSAGFLGRPKGIRGYFEKLSSREGLRVDLSRDPLIKQKLCESLHSVSGLYTWHFLLHGKETAFEARFSIIVDLSKEAPILHHHSSQVPNPLG